MHVPVHSVEALSTRRAAPTPGRFPSPATEMVMVRHPPTGTEGESHLATGSVVSQEPSPSVGVPDEHVTWMDPSTSGMQRDGAGKGMSKWLSA
jgi:hypothetical protein